MDINTLVATHLRPVNRVGFDQAAFEKDILDAEARRVQRAAALNWFVAQIAGARAGFKAVARVELSR